MPTGTLPSALRPEPTSDACSSRSFILAWDRGPHSELFFCLLGRNWPYSRLINMTFSTMLDISFQNITCITCKSCILGVMKDATGGG